MATRFASLFQVALEHEYFGAGENRAFDVTPTATCWAILRRLGLLFRTTERGFTVVYAGVDRFGDEALSPGEPRVDMRRPIDSDVVLQFALHARTPHVVNISDLPLARSFYLFDNRTGRVEGGVGLLTHDAASEVATAQDVLPLRSESFLRSYDTEHAVFELKTLDAHGEAIGARTRRVESVEDPDAPAGSPRRRLVVREDLSALGPGALGPGSYRLRIDPHPSDPIAGNVLTERFYASCDARRERYFGVVEIEISNRIAEGLRVVDGAGRAKVDAEGQPAPVQFRLAFASRRTTWRYHVFLRSTKVGAETLTIEDDGLEFDRSPIDDSTLVFTSKTPITLSETPRRGIRLAHSVPVPTGTTVPVVDDLPNPRIDSFATSGEKLISEMFVYV